MKALWMIWLISLITLTGCAGQRCPEIPREALLSLPAIEIPNPPILNTKKLVEVKTGKEAGQLFLTKDAKKDANYKNDLREAAELGAANTQAANKVFEILREPPKKWWQFWKK